MHPKQCNKYTKHTFRHIFTTQQGLLKPRLERILQIFAPPSRGSAGCGWCIRWGLMQLQPERTEIFDANDDIQWYLVEFVRKFCQYGCQIKSKKP